MDITVVIVNWNTCSLLRNCLQSVYRTIRGMSCEVIVVDNASQDGSVAMLEQEFPMVIIIKNSENRGFGTANNQAFRTMQGRYALLLNTDTILTEKAVSELFFFMENHPQAAMAAGQLLKEDGTKQNSIAAFPTLLTIFANMPLLEYLLPGRYPSKRYEYRDPVEIESGVGACLIVRKKAIDEIGMFDERYFFFFEETDWARQMRSKGWKVYFVPSARIYHLQGKSIGGNIRSRIEFYHSRYQYLRKWNKRPVYKIMVGILFMRLSANCFLTGLANFLMLSSNRNMREKWAVYSKLLLWHLKGCPIRRNLFTELRKEGS